ncbi:DEAD/DEAH box helicase family protein [Pseudomonas aeruginosa]|uniref:DEAD/DEAH box helicase family protein n=1 Tax=Pseudomonas aeruginosa TaxID=287 RepID=UPI0015F11805|nr:DEAD/DEAH box helicase family protein [Pseudomonas aeruginosa]MBA4898708.1 DEAD/DEAH box helicase family protein [Pseudomonas aeruginosa]
MAQILRPYQDKALNELRRGIRDGILVQMLMAPTGAGKTTIASAMKQGACAKGKRAFFIVDSLELVDQAATRFYEDGLEVGVIQGDHSWTDYSKPIQVCTIQTLRSRWQGLPDYLKPDLVVIDEAHVLHKMHKEIIEECVERKIPVIGLSATPFRKGLGRVFGRLVVSATLAELTDQGFLVPAHCYAPSIPDLKGIKTSADGDWADDALAEVMGGAKIMGDVVTNWLQLAKGRQTVVFGCNVAHSRELARQFTEAGILAAHVDGYMDELERAKIIKNYRHGSIRVLCNVAVLTKGFDAPETSCVVLARPTKSLMMHYQMMGRGLRTADGKKDCLAAGTQVLTDKGLVNIEHVTLDHKVWDGVHFVEHGGAVCRGVQPVIEYDGLVATPDHEVMTSEGWKPISEAAHRRLKIAQTGSGGREIRFSENCFKEDGRLWVQPSGRGVVREVRSCIHGQVPQHEEAAKYESLPIMQSKGACGSPAMAVSTLPGPAATLQQSGEFGIREVRGARNTVQVREPKSGCKMGGRKSGNPGRHDHATGSDRQQRALRARESALGSSSRESEQHQVRERQGKVSGIPGKLPARPLRGLDAYKAYSSGILGRRNCGAMEYPVPQAEREVWDIVNAGPLQRFTANGRLVHNCIIIDHAGNCLRNGVPTEPLPTELDDGAGKNSDRRDRNKEKAERLPRPCPKCSHLFATSICPACGFKPQAHEDVEWVDGKLVPIGSSKKRTFSTEEKRDIYAQLLGYAQQHMLKPGWAYFKCQEYCGSAPGATKSVAPKRPSPEIEKWVRHINIKWAKRRTAA